MNAKEKELTVEECIMPLFLALDISPDKAGYKYLKSAVLGYAESNGSMQSLTSSIAGKYLSSVSSVEKDMRSVLKISASLEWRRAFTFLTGYRQKNGKAVPVKKFVAIAAEYLSLEKNREKVFTLKTY